VLRRGKENGKVGNDRALPCRGDGQVGGDSDIGRDTILLSICWDDWEQGGREKVISVMDK